MVSPPIAELVEGNDPSGDTTPGDLSKYNPCNQCRVWAINECLSLSVSTAVVLVHQQVGYSRIWLWFIAGNDEPNRCLCAHKVTCRTPSGAGNSRSQTSFWWPTLTPNRNLQPCLTDERAALCITVGGNTRKREGTKAESDQRQTNMSNVPHWTNINGHIMGKPEWISYHVTKARYPKWCVIRCSSIHKGSKHTMVFNW